MIDLTVIGSLIIGFVIVNCTAGANRVFRGKGGLGIIAGALRAVLR